MPRKTRAEIEKDLNEMEEYAEDLDHRLNEIYEISRPAEDGEEGEAVVIDNESGLRVVGEEGEK